MTAKIDIENREDSNAVSVESTDLFGIRRPLLCVDRPWSAYPLGTKAHSCMGGWWLRTDHGWQWNGKHSTFPTPGGEACGACIELPLPNNASTEELAVIYGAQDDEIPNYEASKKGYRFFRNAPLAQKQMEQELRERLGDDEVDLIKRNEIKIGMSVEGLYASWGVPDRENESVGSWGKHIQHVYRYAYVYSENGIVTSWQK